MKNAFLKENATKIVFMAAVLSFLGVSIPKVAGVYQHYEPHGLLWNIVSYAAAAGIDILAGYLTLVMMNKKARTRDKWIIWAFIITLMLYSWYLNWVFDELNAPGASESTVWALTLINVPVIGQWHVGQLTPLLVAALPVFVIGYGVIAHLINTKAEVVSLEELQRQAAEAQGRAEAEVAIMKARELVTGQRVAGVASLGRSLIKGTLSRGQVSSDQSSDQPDQVITTSDQSTHVDATSDHITDHVITADDQSDHVDTPSDHGIQFSDQWTGGQSDQVITSPDQSGQSDQPTRPTGLRIVGRTSDHVDTDHIRQAIIDHPSVSNRELARMLKCSPTTVGKYRDQMASGQ